MNKPKCWKQFENHEYHGKDNLLQCQVCSYNIQCAGYRVHELMKQVEDLELVLDRFRKADEVSATQIEAMKCCGNCDNQIGDNGIGSSPSCGIEECKWKLASWRTDNLQKSTKEIAK